MSRAGLYGPLAESNLSGGYLWSQSDALARLGRLFVNSDVDELLGGCEESWSKILYGIGMGPGFQVSLTPPTKTLGLPFRLTRPGSSAC